MGRIGAFLNLNRVEAPERPPTERVGDFREFVGTLPLVELREQASRCMECGVPFCHHGCPLGNLIPDWNDLVYRDRWQEALVQLHRTNNFPEFTGRLCPAPCEAACVLEINEGNAVSIKQVELAIVNRGWDEEWIVPQPATRRTGRSVAVVGSGPAGLACAQQLARAGEDVVVYERDEAAGGLVRFGVPEFKIEKRLVERRVQQLVAEGVEFRFGVDVGTDVGAAELRERHDAVVVATGARVPRDLPVPGRELDGVHFAMEYLYDRARSIASGEARGLSAAGKHVVVIGGGDTGADCVANANREGAASVTQIELLGEPPPSRPDDLTPWPRWPMKLRTSYALKEGGRAVVRHLDDALQRRRRTRGGDSLAGELRRAALRPRRRHGGVASGRARAARDGVPRAGGGSPRQTAGGTRCARQRRRKPLPHVRGWRFRCGRRAARTITRRVGDQRGPRVRRRGPVMARRSEVAASGQILSFR